MFRLSVLLLLSLLAFQVALSSNSFDIRHHMTTKSSYWSDPAIASETPFVANSSDTFPTGCQAIFINLLSRHGTRYPTSSDITKLQNLEKKLHTYGQYFKPQYAWLANWTCPYKPQQAGQLVEAGEFELYNLAKRLQTRFSLLKTPYQPYIYQYQTTVIPRAAMSGQSFGYALNENTGQLGASKFQPFFTYSESHDEDYTLRFFDNCPNYDTQVADNDTATIQGTLFDSTILAPLAIQFSKNLGVFPQWQLSVADFKSFYRQCAFDLSIYNITDRFCSLFSPQEVVELEYSSDLSSYYENGYGYPINYQIACPLLLDFVNYTDAYICGTNTDLITKLRFAHAETVMPLISLLGLFNDSSPLMASSTPTEQAQRKWKSSIISPYAANVILVAYNCSSLVKVKLVVNEQEVYIPGCGNTLYCPYDTFLSIYKSALQCPFTEYCFPNGQAACNLHLPQALQCPKSN